MKYQIGDRIVISFTKYFKEFVVGDKNWLTELKKLQDEYGHLTVKSKSPNCKLWLCHDYSDCNIHDKKN